MITPHAMQADVDRVRALVHEWLGSEDSVIVLVDRARTVSFMRGFGLSPCQLELLGVQIERTVRQLVPAGDHLDSGKAVCN